MDKESTNKIKMTRKELLSILQKETDGFNEQSRLRDDVLDAMEEAYLKGKREQLNIAFVSVNEEREVVCGWCKGEGWIDYDMTTEPCKACGGKIKLR